MPKDSLRIALLRPDVEFGRPEANLERLLGLYRRAASLGARIICAPEMCLTGYQHRTPADVAAMAEPHSGGRAAAALSAEAVRLEAFLAAGWAEEGPGGVLYNSALVFAPDGTMVCRYRKVNAEIRWAAPGQPVQPNVFRTPWGGVGLMICADSYDALLPRVTALKGASLVLLPSNWPDDEGFPGELWRQRARENGIWLAAANRRGAEPGLDFGRARCLLADPEGRIRRLESTEDDLVHLTDLPLTEEGEIEDQREERLAGRKPAMCRRAFGNLWAVRDLAARLGLPEPGELDFKAMSIYGGPAPADGGFTGMLSVAGLVDAVAEPLGELPPGALVALPRWDYSDADLARLSILAEGFGLCLVGSRSGVDVPFALGQRGTGPGEILPVPSSLGPWPVFHWGPARVLAAPLEFLAHPEAAVAAAKEGVDLAVCPAASLSDDDLRLAALRSIERLAVAACAPGRSIVSLIPTGHGAGAGAIDRAGRGLSMVVDTRETRDKRFQDRVDYETLLSPGVVRTGTLFKMP